MGIGRWAPAQDGKSWEGIEARNAGITTRLARVTSFDGELVLVAERYVEPSGEVAAYVAFEGMLWHFHTDDLETRHGRTPEQIALDIVDDVVADRMLITITTAPGFRLVTLAYEIELEIALLSKDETMEWRFWSGRKASGESLMDGTVSYKALPLR